MKAPVDIWTDGACSGNPGPMGIGVVVIDGATRKELGEHLGDGTSNIAELVAIERGLLIALELTGAPARQMRVHSDSAYSIGILSKDWKAKANTDLVTRIRHLLEGMPNVTFVKVRGHNGVPENERCDELARAASTGADVQAPAPAARPAAPERCRVYKEPCPDHGFIHGAEAEELREGIEALIGLGDGATTEDLQRMLERVDARDSLAYREATRRDRKARR